ncbi:MAG TPA: alpha/beta fold hydrolase [Nitrospiria bacterium]|nr:alpha/beta fold hydrolase [Nitrospiria bacterium]
MAQLRVPGRPSDHLDYTLTPPAAGRPATTLVTYVHGFASDQSGEKVLYLRDRFTAAGCAFLAFDHRGHGRSSGTIRELTVSRNLEDLDAVLQQHVGGYARHVLVGSSMGGQTAAWYAARHPDVIAAAVLIAPGFRFIERRMEELGPKGLERLRQSGQIVYKNQWVEVTIGPALFDDAGQYPMDRLLALYRTPSLLLHGTEDDSVPFEDSVVFTKLTKARPLELVLIAGGDHRLTDRKETLFSEIEAFLRRLRLLP